MNWVHRFYTNKLAEMDDLLPDEKALLARFDGMDQTARAALFMDMWSSWVVTVDFDKAYYELVKLEEIKPNTES